MNVRETLWDFYRFIWAMTMACGSVWLYGWLGWSGWWVVLGLLLAHTKERGKDSKL